MCKRFYTKSAMAKYLQTLLLCADCAEHLSAHCSHFASCKSCTLCTSCARELSTERVRCAIYLLTLQYCSQNICTGCAREQRGEYECDVFAHIVQVVLRANLAHCAMFKIKLSTEKRVQCICKHGSTCSSCTKYLHKLCKEAFNREGVRWQSRKDEAARRALCPC